MKKVQAIQFGGAAVIVLLFLVVIYYVIPQLYEPISLGISLQEKNISQFQEGVLNYQIVSNKGPIYNLRINNTIIGYDSYLHQFKVIESMPSKQVTVDSFVFSTNSLPKGTYIVKTSVDYVYKNENKSTELTLGFNVI